MSLARRVLVVTRDGDLLRLVVEATEPSAVVEIAFDAHSAIRLLRSSRFALILLDEEVLMESEQGWIIDECLRRQPATPIVYVGSRFSAASEGVANSHGVASYVAKPIVSAVFQTMIRSLFPDRRAGRSGSSRRLPAAIATAS